MPFYVVVHKHRHGESVYCYVGPAPVADEEVISQFDIDFEEDKEECLDTYEFQDGDIIELVPCKECGQVVDVHTHDDGRTTFTCEDCGEVVYTQYPDTPHGWYSIGTTKRHHYSGRAEGAFPIYDCGGRMRDTHYPDLIAEEESRCKVCLQWKGGMDAEK